MLKVRDFGLSSILKLFKELKLVLSFGMLGFIAKNVIQWFIHL